MAGRRHRSTTGDPAPELVPFDAATRHGMPVGTPAGFGLLAKARRLHLQLRQHEVAARAGVSRQWLSDLERGRPSLDFGLVLKVYETLEVTLFIQDFKRPPEWAQALAQGRDRAALERQHNHRNKRRKVVRQTKKVRRRLLSLILARAS